MAPSPSEDIDRLGAQESDRRVNRAAKESNLPSRGLPGPARANAVCLGIIGTVGQAMVIDGGQTA